MENTKVNHTKSMTKGSRNLVVDVIMGLFCLALLSLSLYLIVISSNNNQQLIYAVKSLSNSKLETLASDNSTALNYAIKQGNYSASLSMQTGIFSFIVILFLGLIGTYMKMDFNSKEKELDEKVRKERKEIFKRFGLLESEVQDFHRKYQKENLYVAAVSYYSLFELFNGQDRPAEALLWYTKYLRIQYQRMLMDDTDSYAKTEFNEVIDNYQAIIDNGLERFDLTALNECISILYTITNADKKEALENYLATFINARARLQGSK
ncbi:MAG: hypothetical protein CVU48_01550 [Candidatus Cloacimonetes bacterium HGW-Cloacimonetes-1]|jgi:hypothetical protein|nr:MAG: hypothetical protein CVU48_01550 [Candidatus Cloacimonetes bacterium HGW-Cloacimonetes-1]